MPSIDLIDLELIALLSAELSQSAVAQRMGVTAPAVSQRIAKMEELTGHQLVFRAGPLRLTRAGCRLLRAAHAVRQELHALHNDLQEMASGAPTLRVMANVSLMIDDLPLVLGKLKAQMPQLQIELAEGSFSDITRAVLEGESDTGLLVGRQQVDGLRFLPYKQDRVCLIAPTSHLLAQHKQIAFSMAAAHPFIGADSGKQISAFIEAIERKQNLRIRYAMRVSSFEVQAHLVAQTGIGVALVLESVARRYASIYPLRLVSLTDDWASGDFVICVRERGAMSAACRTFVRMLQQRFNTSIDRN